MRLVFPFSVQFQIPVALCTVLALQTGCAVKTYRAKQGETLVEIARKEKVSLEALMWLNKRTYAWDVTTGDLLLIPPKGRTNVSAGTAEIPGTSSQKKNRKPEASHPKKMVASKTSRSEPLSPFPKITRPFGDPLPQREKLLLSYGMHDGTMNQGIDLAAPLGTPILAAEDGRVIYSDDHIRGYGKLIIIKHEGNFTTVYAHNEENRVKAGDFVQRGATIATVGASGGVEFPQLHFEVRFGVKSIDPALVLLPQNVGGKGTEVSE